MCKVEVGSEISLDDHCALLEASEVLKTLDIGSALIQQISHPAHGKVTLVNTICGRAAVIA